MVVHVNVAGFRLTPNVEPEKLSLVGEKDDLVEAITMSLRPTGHFSQDFVVPTQGTQDVDDNVERGTVTAQQSSGKVFEGR
ncbi:MAG: hypothetical protein ACR2HV_00705 [Acidimicrobiales bacterium]